MTADQPKPPLVYDLSERAVDNALEQLHHHVPTDVDPGPARALSPWESTGDGRRVCVLTQSGAWFVSVAWGAPGVVHVRRVDSPLDEPYRITGGQVERIEYRDGREVGRSTAELTAELDRMLQPLRDQGVE